MEFRWQKLNSDAKWDSDAKSKTTWKGYNPNFWYFLSHSSPRVQENAVQSAKVIATKRPSSIVLEKQGWTRDSLGEFQRGSTLEIKLFLLDNQLSRKQKKVLKSIKHSCKNKLFKGFNFIRVFSAKRILSKIHIFGSSNVSQTGYNPGAGIYTEYNYVKNYHMCAQLSYTL